MIRDRVEDVKFGGELQYPSKFLAVLHREIVIPVQSNVKGGFIHGNDYNPLKIV
jgi:hypothetical protein